MSEVIELSEPDKVYNIMEASYRILASYTDVEKCREAVQHFPLAAWIGVFPNNAPAETIPMWDVSSFMRNSQ